MSSDLTPLEVCEALLGPIETVSEIAGCKPKSGYAWRNPAKGRLAGDIPSAIHMRRLLAYSKRHKLGLTAEHLIKGATRDQISEILERRKTADKAAGGIAA